MGGRVRHHHAHPLGATRPRSRHRREYDRYRDERAVDIDHRLEKSDTGVKTPF